MSKFQTKHSHHATVLTTVLHLGAPLLAGLLSNQAHSIFFAQEPGSIVGASLIDVDKFQNFFPGLVGTISASLYGFSGNIPNQEVMITHLNGQDEKITIKASNTWADTFMKFSPILSLVDLCFVNSYWGIGGALVSAGLGAYEAFTDKPVDYHFYSGNTELLNLSLDSDHLLEQGLPIHFIVE